MVPGRRQQAPSLALQAYILGFVVSRQVKSATSKLARRAGNTRGMDIEQELSTGGQKTVADAVDNQSRTAHSSRTRNLHQPERKLHNG